MGGRGGGGGGPAAPPPPPARGGGGVRPGGFWRGGSGGCPWGGGGGAGPPAAAQTQARIGRGEKVSFPPEDIPARVRIISGRADTETEQPARRHSLILWGNFKPSAQYQGDSGRTGSALCNPAPDNACAYGA